jgi:hypothetical protein
MTTPKGHPSSRTDRSWQLFLAVLTVRPPSCFSRRREKHSFLRHFPPAGAPPATHASCRWPPWPCSSSAPPGTDAGPIPAAPRSLANAEPRRCVFLAKTVTFTCLIMVFPMMPPLVAAPRPRCPVAGRVAPAARRPTPTCPPCFPRQRRPPPSQVGSHSHHSARIGWGLVNRALRCVRHPVATEDKTAPA